MYSKSKLLIGVDAKMQGSIEKKCPSNIAIVKYWGKYGNQLPRNPSVSFTLTNAFTKTKLKYQTRNGGDKHKEISLKFNFEGKENEVFRLKQVKFLESLLTIFPFLGQMDLSIESSNSFPHSAGIASSASSMGALALCLCELEQQLFGGLEAEEDFLKKASYVARLGSGSACRSVYKNAAIWGTVSEYANSSNLYAVPFGSEIHPIFEDYHDDILIVGKGEKSVSSRMGHGLMVGNPYSAPRYKQARNRMSETILALKTGDLELFGQICEDEAMTLHALMMASSPSFTLMRPNTIAVIEQLRAFRAETKLPIYFTLDAGPNPHVFYPDGMRDKIEPFIEEILKPFCENQRIIKDIVVA
jgi:diphosphomevalonate decarboxylase